MGVARRFPLWGLVALCLVGWPQGVSAQEAPGRWRFSDESRPAKAVVIGGSVAAYGGGGFAQWLPEVCEHLEVVNQAKARLGAADLRHRFVAQVLRNRRLSAEDKEGLWLIFLGGLNSVSMPERTNYEVAQALKAAKEAGLKTMALTINPWGSERDRRWVGLEGLRYFDFTQKTVDFIMGRLSPEDAFGPQRVAGREDVAHYLEGELPDIAVELWDHALRDREAAPRDMTRHARLGRRLPWVAKALAALPVEERDAHYEGLLTKAAELSQWFMRSEYRGFDAIHPNALGHREIARSICLVAPEEWGCHCEALDGLEWDRAKRQARPIPAVSPLTE